MSERYWLIQRGERVQDISERRLRRSLRAGRLSGLEMARPATDKEWRYLCDYDLFKEEVPAGQGNVPVASLMGATFGFVAHLLIFLAVTGETHMPLVPAIAWFIGVAGHGLGTFRMIRAARRRREERLLVRARLLGGVGSPQVVAPVQQVVATPTPAVQPAEVSDPFEVELAALLQEIGKDKARVQNLGIDLESVRTTAQATHRRRLQLEALADLATRERLLGERIEVERELGETDDELSAESLKAQLRAIDDRMATMTEAATVATRLKSRERTLLHQLEDLRLGMLRTDIDEQNTAPLGVQVQRIQGEVKAMVETEVHLARARSGALRG